MSGAPVKRSAEQMEGAGKSEAVKKINMAVTQKYSEEYIGNTLKIWEIEKQLKALKARQKELEDVWPQAKMLGGITKQMHSAEFFRVTNEKGEELVLAKDAEEAKKKILAKKEKEEENKKKQKEKKPKLHPDESLVQPGSRTSIALIKDHSSMI